MNCSTGNGVLWHLRVVKSQNILIIHTGLSDFSFSLYIFLCFHKLVLRTVKTQLSLRKCAGWSEPSLFEQVTESLLMLHASNNLFDWKFWLLRKLETLLWHWLKWQYFITLYNLRITRGNLIQRSSVIMTKVISEMLGF